MGPQSRFPVDDWVVSTHGNSSGPTRNPRKPAGPILDRQEKGGYLMGSQSVTWVDANLSPGSYEYAHFSPTPLVRFHAGLSCIPRKLPGLFLPVL
jgi:hypothetical protein